MIYFLTTGVDLMSKSNKESEQDSVHSSIMESGATEEPTIKQCSYLIYLYKAKLKSKILKRHSRLQGAKTSDFPFFVRKDKKTGRATIGTFALHFLNTFAVSENINRGQTSALIKNAVINNKFDMKLVGNFLTSANSYKPKAKA